jgi:hypothetical protein
MGEWQVRDREKRRQDRRYRRWCLSGCENGGTSSSVLLCMPTWPVGCLHGHLEGVYSAVATGISVF